MNLPKVFLFLLEVPL